MSGRVTLYGWDRGGGVSLCIGCERCSAWRSSAIPLDHDTGATRIEDALFAWAISHGWSVEPPRCPQHVSPGPGAGGE